MKKSLRLLLASTLVYLLLLILLVAAEAGAPGATIKGFWDAVWFSLITMTTVGYGDLAPVTAAGRFLGLIFALCSIGILTALISLGIQLISGQFLPRLRLRLNRGKNWYVFNDQTPDALTLARKLQSGDPKALFLFPRTTDAAERDPSFVLLDSDLPGLAALRGGTGGMVFFGMGEDRWQNYTEGLSAAALHIPSYCMADVTAERLPPEMHLFSLREVLSRSYWQNHPLGRRENQIVLIGCDTVGSALLERALLTNVFEPGRRICWHVFGNVASFAALHPALVRALGPEGEDDLLHLHTGSWTGERALIQAADRIILCGDSEEENLTIYSELRSWFPTAASVHLLLQTPVSGLDSFGDREGTLTPELVMRDKINHLAMRMNDLYNRHAQKPVPWHDLSEFLRQSNIAAADHLSVKVRFLLEQDTLTDIGPEQYREAYNRYLSRRETEADLFQEMEHRRWLRFYRMYNWEYDPVRDNALRRHPMILPYAELSEADQNKDAYAWELLGEFAGETSL